MTRFLSPVGSIVVGGEGTVESFNVVSILFLLTVQMLPLSNGGSVAIPVIGIEQAIFLHALGQFLP
jgi:hypothetical protein